MDQLIINKILDVLQSGCNERTIPNKDGFLKYGIALHSPDLVNRGSCTSNTATLDNIESISKAITNHENCISEKHLIQQRTSKIKSLLAVNGSVDFEVFYAPSGTDLSYYPILFAKVMYPEKPILNIVTCSDEVGGGTSISAEGRHHGAMNQFGAPIEKGGKVLNMSKIKVHTIEVRGQEGQILSSMNDLDALVESYGDDNVIIINLAYCSKSGVEDNLSVLDRPWANKVLWNVDLCQFRHDKEVINRLLRKKAAIMITGSKFYQSPPFCGAMLVPRTMFAKLEHADWSVVDGYRDVFSKFDMPNKLHDKVDWNPTFNLSTHARWACAIDEMQRFDNLNQYQAKKVIINWHRKMVDYIKNSEHLELMPGQENTNKTIIPFKVKVNGKCLGIDELKKFHYDFVTQDYSEVLGNKHVFIGQPVKYGNDQAFLRLAVGSKNIRQFIDENDNSFIKDVRILNILQEQLKSAFVLA